MKIFVGNLNYKMEESALEQLFSEYGQVDSVKIITDRDTGRAKGFAFIEMPDDAQGQAAIDALNGTDAMGRAIVVNVAKDRQ